jgi:hypothetical protein
MTSFISNNSIVIGSILDISSTTTTVAPTTTTTGQPASDPYFNSVVSLLHMDGADNSSVFTDSSNNNLLFTPFGGTQIKTQQSQSGGASAFFDGNDDYLRATITPGLLYYDLDFTIEFFFRRTGVGSGQVHTVFEAGNIQSGLGGLHIYVDSDGVFSVNNGLVAGIQGGLAPLDTWVHVALVRFNGTNKLYVDGAYVDQNAQDFGETVENDIISIGGAPNYGFYANGWIDEFRITQEARYVSAFSIPPVPFPNQ